MTVTRFDGRVWDTLGERGNLLAVEGWRYTSRGRARHMVRSISTALCGLYVGDWLGTDSQDERKRLARLPKCARCMRIGAL